MNWRTQTFLEIVELLALQFAMPYKESRSYLIGQSCIYQGKSYTASDDTTGTFNATNWTAGTTKDRLFWTDIYNSQFAHIGDNGGEHDELPYPFPCVFVEFSETEYSSIANGLQEGTTTIRIHIGQKIYADAYDLSNQQSLALYRYDYIDQVFAALHLQSGTYFDQLKRTREQLATDHSNVIHDILEYTVRICDDAGQDTDSHTPINITAIHLNPEYNGDTVMDEMLTKPEIKQVLANNKKPSQSQYLIP